MQWQPDGDSSDSDFSLSYYKRKKGKFRKAGKSEATRAAAASRNPSDGNGKLKVASKEETAAAARRNADDANDSGTKNGNGKLKVASKEETAAAARRNADDGNGKLKIASKEERTAAARRNAYDETRSTRPDLPEQELHVDMNVLAKRKTHRWQRGKILEIITKEDGRVKYKVDFQESGRSLVSGHHIAFVSTPSLEQLYVGARVVVTCQDSAIFQPGILAELPSRKNRLRFLVFLDDHKPHYLGLPALHLVCRPFEDSLEDLPDGLHKTFMKKYMRDWPYPHLTHFSPGDDLNLDVNGVQQKCDVEVVDCSLMEVVFQEDQHKEWIHRGSMRLEHMQRYLNVTKAEEQD
ncbi:histone-lysine N-methyltransferase SETDB1-B-like [Brachionichthys hirsutus]|uniref:histone-lysine N-methyltransferase SETDB1-B-like n=1 Tax=Brachionichthys hirsutus TaxID=412623 RepID=UPI0036045D70